MVGYMRMSSDGNRQTTGLQRDALRAASVDDQHLYEDEVSRARADCPGLARALDISAINDYIEIMPAIPSTTSITIRNLDRVIKERLRIRAAQHGHSMEAEVRSILQTTLQEPGRVPSRTLYERIRARFEPLGGADDLQLPPRLQDRDPPRFD